jgi:O-methyltransferase
LSKDTQNLCFVKGEFEKSVSYVDIPQISILHLDCDYYDPTLLMLEKYYPQMSKNGYVIVNNYFYEYVNIKKAIDDFRTQYQIQSPIQKLSSTYAYWRV